MKSDLSTFVTFAFSVISKKPLPNPESQRITPKFSFKSFFALTFRPMAHFELVFVCDMR